MNILIQSLILKHVKGHVEMKRQKIIAINNVFYSKNLETGLAVTKSKHVKKFLRKFSPIRPDTYNYNNTYKSKPFLIHVNFYYMFYYITLVYYNIVF